MKMHVENGRAARWPRRTVKDERLTAQLAPIYKTGFWVLALGILFDVFTRYNYLAQTDAEGNAVVQSPLEAGVLAGACILVMVMMGYRNVYSDSLRYANARTFGETGSIVPAVCVGLFVAAAATGGRLFSEVALFGWEHVTWAGDAAMFLIIAMMFCALFVAASYLLWFGYRRKEDALAREDTEA